MLGNKEAIATIAVRDLKAARKFYEGVVGLEVVDAEEDGAVTYRSGSSSILVYESQYAGSNKATAATWLVGDGLEGIVRSLKAKGVAFEHYELPGMTRNGDVHVGGSLKAAWFKDPDGNIHALISE